MSTLASVADPPSAVASLDHISFTSLSLYRNCPRRFYYRYVEKAPEEFVPASLAFGGSLHRCVEKIHQARLEGNDIPAVESLLTEYDSAWKDSTSEAPEIRFAKTDDQDSLRLLADRMLAAYRQHVISKADQ